MERHIIELSEEIQELNREITGYSIRDDVQGGTLLGFVLGVVAFFGVGSWYNERYGFSGSREAALGMAFLVFILCFLLGVIVGCAHKSRKEKVLQQTIAELKWEKTRLEKLLQQEKNLRQTERDA